LLASKEISKLHNVTNTILKHIC